MDLFDIFNRKTEILLEKLLYKMQIPPSVIVQQ